MNSRQRVTSAITFATPDRAPISHAVLPAAQMKYGAALDEILATYREDFGWDGLDDMSLEELPPPYRPGLQRDDFGTVWRVERAGICGIPAVWPLADWNAYGSYRWPELAAGPPARRLYSGHRCGGDEQWYARGAWITFFEQLQQLRGMENLLMDVAEESAEFCRLADDLLAFNLRWIDRWTKLPYQGLHFADDWGEQQRLLIRPEKWRRLFKPRYAEMFARVKAAGMHVWFHSDGFINDIFGDLIEIGVDVINSQTKVVGLDWVAANARGKVAFRTDIDRQRVMPFGSPAEVDEEVQRTFEACGTPQGGIIACGEIGPDVPLENIRAMYEAFAKYGRIPGEGR
jgi:uroporphyrinogen decarboxylase